MKSFFKVFIISFISFTLLFGGGVLTFLAMQDNSDTTHVSKLSHNESAKQETLELKKMYSLSKNDSSSNLESKDMKLLNEYKQVAHERQKISQNETLSNETMASNIVDRNIEKYSIIVQDYRNLSASQQKDFRNMLLNDNRDSELKELGIGYILGVASSLSATYIGYQAKKAKENMDSTDNLTSAYIQSNF
ncbi:hypothetical protein [Wukongibacter baidiensis]